MLTKSDIKLIKSLGDKAARKEHGLFVVEGDKMVDELYGAGLIAERVLVTENASTFTLWGQDCEVVSPKEMERISHLKTPSDALAIVRIPHTKPIGPKELSGRLTLALEDIQDPGNLGTIIRVADWFGIRDIVCSPATADCYNPKVVQATMGALFRVNVHYLDLLPALESAKKAGIEIYGTFLDGEEIYAASLGDSGIILMGNEGKGISRQAAASVTRRLLIPSYPPGRQGSESLNVATATAITCSEFRRRQ